MKLLKHKLFAEHLRHSYAAASHPHGTQQQISDVCSAARGDAIGGRLTASALTAADEYATYDRTHRQRDAFAVRE